MKFLDVCAGIGGFRLALEAAGHECVGFIEIDKHARASYKAIHGLTGEKEYSEWEWHNVKSLSNKSLRKLQRRIGQLGILSAGFPCQAFSIAGKRKGFADTRGTIFFEIARLASILRPRYLLLENVKGLLNHEGGATFETILRALDELGYDAEWSLLNSKEYVAQNRERVFIVGHLRGGCTRKVFPLNRESKSSDTQRNGINIVGTTKPIGSTRWGDKDVVYGADGISGTLLATDYKNVRQVAIPVLTPDRLDKRQNGRRFKSDGEEMFTLTAQDRHGIMIAGKLPGSHDQNSRIYDPEGVAPTLSTMQGGGQEPKILVKEATKKGYSEASPGDSINISHVHSKTRRGRIGKQTAHTLLTDKKQAVITETHRIRKLTPRECWRLQTFPDWAFDRAAAVNSDSQLYKQAGNSVTVAVVYDIAKSFVEVN